MYSPLIRRIALTRGLQDADAKEVVQDVLIAIIKAIPNYERKTQVGSFRSWLTTIARNKTLNRLSRVPVDVANRVHDVDMVGIVGGANQVAESRELEHQWRQQIFVLAAQDIRARVQPTTWSAFWMSAVEDRPCEEVATELGISVGAVYVARSRIIAKIRDWVRKCSSKWEFEHQ